MLTLKVAAVVLAAAAALYAATGYHVVDRYPVPGTGGFDYVAIDSVARRIYVSHGTQVDVVDADNGKVVGTIDDTPGVHGIALAPDFKHGFTSNGRENKVSMFDPATLKLIKKIDVGAGPDGIYYDPASKRVFTNNHGSHNVSAIDASTGDVVGAVKLDGDGEQAIIGNDGLIYVNSENTGEVVVFDPKSLEVKKRFPIGVAKTPTGLAYDAKTNRLFIGCREKPAMVVMDAASGKVITSMPIGAGVDFAGFDPDARRISRRGPTLAALATSCQPSFHASTVTPSIRCPCRMSSRNRITLKVTGRPASISPLFADAKAVPNVFRRHSPNSFSDATSS